MRTPRHTLILLGCLWAAGHAALSMALVAAFTSEKFAVAELLAYYLIAWQPLAAISIYGETRNAWLGQPQDINVAIPSLGVIAVTWVAWQMLH